MTKEEAKSCIGTIEMLQRLAYNIHGVMDVIDADNCKKIIKALEQEPTRPKGKWISYHCGAYYECSNCHERNSSRYDKYCKFCGAEMEGVEE